MKKISFYREPLWVRTSPEVIPPTWWSVLTGTVLHSVKGGEMCRTFSHPGVPNVLRFTNGVAAGFIRDFILVKCPNVAKKVFLETNTLKPEKGYRGFKRLTGYVGSIDFLSCRSHAQPLYVANRTNVYKSLMKRTHSCFESVFVPTVLELCKRLKEKSKTTNIAVVDEMHYVATSLLTRVAFDEHSDKLDKNLFDSALWIINDTLARPQNNNFRFLDLLPTPTNRSLKRKQELLVQTVKEIIENKRKQNLDGRSRDDVVSTLLANEINKDNDLIGILSIFFFAGFDTTSNTMTFALNLLAENDDVQQKCRDEIDDIVGIDEPPTIQRLHHLRYLKAVISETLRLYPTIPMVAREVTEKHEHVCPRYDEANAFGIAINMFGLHYNESGWAQPESFVPERWLNKEFDEHLDESQRVYCPFALGKRSCLGKQFAIIEMLTVLCMVLQRFEIKTCGSNLNESVKEAGSLVVDPGFKLKFVPIDEDSLFMDVSENSEQGLVTYTREEVSRHKNIEDAWFIIDNKVYDITNYLARDVEPHPGGNEVMLNFAGCDATDDFNEQGHTDEAVDMLKEFLIGKVNPLRAEPIPNTSRRSSSTVFSQTSRGRSTSITLNTQTRSRFFSVYELGQMNNANRRSTSLN